MFKRSIVLVLIVCVFSFFFINNISYAGTALNTWVGAREKVETAKSIMETERDQYHVIQEDLKALIGEWDDAEIAKANHDLLSVIAVAGAVISIASGGSLYPAAYVLAVTGAKAIHTQSNYDVQKEKYLTSMSALLALMDTARANVDSAYNGGYLVKEPPGSYIGEVYYAEHTPGYDPEYDAYLSMAVSHLNGYEYYIGKYENKVTLKFEVLENSVKGGGTSGYYHRGFHTGDTTSKEDHVFTKFMTFGDFVVKPDLPYKYQCKGNYQVCNGTFRTPYEAKYAHLVKCGTAASYSQLVRAYLPDSYTTGNFTFELGVRTVE